MLKNEPHKLISIALHTESKERQCQGSVVQALATDPHETTYVATLNYTLQIVKRNLK
jgi:hypothetical protein